MWARHQDPIVALLLAMLTVVLLVMTADDMGLTWDEPVYIEASQSYVSWFGELVTQPVFALSQPEIDRFWALNHEHPPVDKVWSGLVWAGTRSFLDDLTAHRLGNILLVGVLVALLYLLLVREYGRFAGVMAVGALLVMPRFFFHAHLAALDVPASVMMVGVTFVFWRTQDRTRATYGLILGVVLALALGTKLNTLVTLPALGLYVLIFRRRLYLLGRLALSVLVATPVWLLTWPWLYHDTFNRTIAYVQFLTVDHYKIGQWYLGRYYQPPPWHFAFFMTIAVVPLTLLVLSLLGALAVLLGRPRQYLGWLLIFSAAIPILLLAVDTGSAYDNDRLLMPAFPYIAALAGVGFYHLLRGIQKLADRLRQPRWAKPLALLAAFLAFAPQIVSAWGLYPHLLSYYSEAVGGLPGATRLGFESTYWSETYTDALAYLNSHAEPGAIVWVEAHDVMLYFQSVGKLRRDLRVASRVGAEGIVPGTQGYSLPIDAADFAVIQYRQSGFSNEIRKWMAGRTPVYQLSRDGVTIMEIYKRQ